jgi:hypothetical protein
MKETTVVAVAVILSAILIFRGMSVGPEVAVRTLESSGYSQIQILDTIVVTHTLNGCDPFDTALIQAKALYKGSIPVRVGVCIEAFSSTGRIIAQ